MRLSALIEVITGLTLLAAPDAVIRALIGANYGAAATVVGRVLGGALVGLGIAGAPARRRSPERGIVLAYVVYDVSTATALAVASLDGAADGSLTWPVVGLHAFLAVALLGSLLPRGARPPGAPVRAGTRCRDRADVLQIGDTTNISASS